jgi:hypothetical protein
MPLKSIKKMLDLYSIDYYIKNGRIFAIMYYFTRNGKCYEKAQDLTGISRLNLLSWLNA